MVKIAGVGAARVAAWNAGHDELLAGLRRRAPPAKVIVLNNRRGAGEGQLFERWGNQVAALGSRVLVPGKPRSIAWCIC